MFHLWLQNHPFLLTWLAQTVFFFLVAENAKELTRDFDDPENNKYDYFVIGENYIDRILALLARLLLEREGIDDERARCLKVLKITNPNVQLDVEIDEILKVTEFNFRACYYISEITGNL